MRDRVDIIRERDVIESFAIDFPLNEIDCYGEKYVGLKTQT